MGGLSACTPNRKPGDLTFRRHILETRDGQKIEVELGRLVVPESRHNLAGGLIDLAFVRLRSRAKSPGYPMVYLAGGPSDSGIDNARGSLTTFLLGMREIGDVIALDQRGVGMTEPNLACSENSNYPLDRPATREETIRLLQERGRDCARFWKAAGVDLAAYNTNESADDVEALRQALGAEKISLIAISYGTTLALTTVRRHGEHIHRVIFAGMEAPDQTYKLPSDGQKQLLKIAQICKDDPKFGLLMPDLVGTLKAVSDRLQNQPQTVEVLDTDTNRKVKVTVGDFDLRLMTASVIGRDIGIRTFPAQLYSRSRGDFSPLGQWALLVRHSGMSAMAFAMDCASGFSPERWATIQREESETLLGRDMDFPFPEVCEAWNVPELEPTFRSELKSDVPALFVSGTLDGRTPVSNADEIRKGFPNSATLIVEGAAHGFRLLNGSPQIEEIIAQFIKGQPLSMTKVSLGSVDLEPPKDPN
jgi:pimeloyl-ACP methyl ester carboxylesterase